jgi:peptidoglycan/LPS O-acetylase OafA/YrhL
VVAYAGRPGDPPDDPFAGETALARTIHDAPRGVDPEPSEPATTRRSVQRARRAGVRASDSRHFGYQPALDGIRAFAVGGVLFYHAGQSWAVGGFLGVDTFFVLSGFLITTLLVTEWTNRGGIDLLQFWVRRARRLLPALFLVMVGIIVYAGVFAGAGELERIRADSYASLGYVANWRFIFSGQSYFDQFTQPSPLRHMWSLAIEEQFYLVWPLIVAGILWWRRSLRVLLAACVVLIAGSATLMALLYEPGRDPSRVYYGTDTRAQSLLIGAVVGILLFMHGPLRTRIARVAIRVAAVVGAGYTLWLFWRMSERTDALYQGGFLFAALAVSAVIVSVVQPDRGVLGRFLSLTPLRWVGRISYGLYLWHWPVYLTLTEKRIGLDGVALLSVRVAVSVAFATLSFYALERPIRAGTFKLPAPRIIAVAAVTALVAGVFFTTTGGGESIAARTERALSGGAVAPKATPPSTAATGATGADGTTDANGAPIPPPPPKVMIVGDSVAGTIGLGYDDLGASSGLTVWNRGRLGCGLFYDGQIIEGGELQPVDSHCDWRATWPIQLDQFKPDIVVMLVGAWDILDREVDGHVVKFGSVEYDSTFLHLLDDATTLLGSTGAKVVVLTTPFFSRPELAIQTGREWPEYEPWRVDRINSLYRDFLANHPGRYRMLDLNKFVSPQGKFTDELDGQVVRGDGVHFTKAGSLMVVNWLTPQLKDIAAGGDPDPADDAERPDRRSLWAK